MNKDKVIVPARARGSEPGTRLDSTVITRQFGEIGERFSERGAIVEVTKIRIVKTGQRIEVYQYELPLVLHRKVRKKVVIREKSERDQEYRNRRAHRANNTIRRLANGNFIERAVFVTLTFDNDQSFDINDISASNKRLRTFIKKLQTQFPDFKYIAVLEFQQRGAVHYHMLCNLPYIEKEELASNWGHGFIDIQYVRDTQKIGGYLAKYMAKNCTDPRFTEHRSYFTSKNLNRPTVLYGLQALKILDKFPREKLSLSFKNEYKSSFNGLVKFHEYNLNYSSPSENEKENT